MVKSAFEWWMQRNNISSEEYNTKWKEFLASAAVSETFDIQIKGKIPTKGPFRRRNSIWWVCIMVTNECATSKSQPQIRIKEKYEKNSKTLKKREKNGKQTGMLTQNDLIKKSKWTKANNQTTTKCFEMIIKHAFAMGLIRSWMCICFFKKEFVEFDIKIGTNVCWLHSFRKSGLYRCVWPIYNSAAAAAALVWINKIVKIRK